MALSADLFVGDSSVQEKSEPFQPFNHQDENDEMDFENEVEDEFISPTAFLEFANSKLFFEKHYQQIYSPPFIEGDNRPPRA